MTIIEPDVVEDQDANLSNADGDHERFKHIVHGGPNAAAKLTEARVFGIPVKALCGKEWVPQRDPDKFPICPDCVKAFETITGRKWKGA